MGVNATSFQWRLSLQPAGGEQRSAKHCPSSLEHTSLRVPTVTALPLLDVGQVTCDEGAAGRR